MPYSPRRCSTAKRSFNYMIDRTLYRPREIIQFCTDALEEGRVRRAADRLLSH